MSCEKAGPSPAYQYASLVHGSADTDPAAPPMYQPYPDGLFSSVPPDILRAMAAHSDSLRTADRKSSIATSSTLSSYVSSWSPASSSTASSRRSSAFSDLEHGHQHRARRLSLGRTKRTSLVAGGAIAGCIAVYMLLDNFLLADWVSATARHPEDITWEDGSTTDASFNGLDIVDWDRTSSWMSPGVLSIASDPTHVLVPTPSQISHPVSLLEAPPRFPKAVMLEYYVNGTIPQSISSAVLDYPIKDVDIVYTFVNASSPVLQAAKDARAKDEELQIAMGAARHWRDNGELRGAVRSVAQSLRQGLRRIHFVSADFELDSDLTEEDEPEEDDDLGVFNGGDDGDATYDFMESHTPQSWTVGQVPFWLDTQASADKVHWHFHSEIFRLPMNDGRLPHNLQTEWQSEEEWRHEAQPSFNSFEIESRVGWIKGLNHNFILSNDDMFFLKELSTADFHHPLLGPIMRLAPEASLRVKPFLTWDSLSTSGEWGGLQHANTLLSDRFYKKDRMYMSHVPKSLTKTVVHEASIMFAPALSRAATRGFRESKRGKADVHFAWLVSHLHIERWREAVLWSWAVARLGGAEGLWGQRAREELWGLLDLPTDGQVEIPRDVVVHRKLRETIADMDGIMEDNDWPFPEASDFMFTSMDGHLPNDLGSSRPSASCIFTLTQCLPADFFTSTTPYPADAMFTHIAFLQPACGDCLVTALISASGPRGLSAILPTEEQVFTPPPEPAGGEEMWRRSEPMLPLVPTWSEGNFSLASVVHLGQDRWEGEAPRPDGTVSLRDFSVKLLSRYVYSLARSPTHFALARNVGDLVNALTHIDTHESLALICMNDDQPDDAGPETADILNAWMRRRWGGVEVPWERKEDRRWDGPKTGMNWVAVENARKAEGEKAAAALKIFGNGLATLFASAKATSTGGTRDANVGLGGPGQG